MIAKAHCACCEATQEKEGGDRPYGYEVEDDSVDTESGEDTLDDDLCSNMCGVELLIGRESSLPK